MTPREAFNGHWKTALAVLTVLGLLLTAAKSWVLLPYQVIRLEAEASMIPAQLEAIRSDLRVICRELRITDCTR